MKKSRHSEEKVIAAVKQMEGGRKTADVARELGVSAATLYTWKGKYGGMQISSSEQHGARSACLSSGNAIAINSRGETSCTNCYCLPFSPLASALLKLKS